MRSPALGRVVVVGQVSVRVVANTAASPWMDRCVRTPGAVVHEPVSVGWLVGRGVRGKGVAALAARERALGDLFVLDEATELLGEYRRRYAADAAQLLSRYAWSIAQHCEQPFPIAFALSAFRFSWPPTAAVGTSRAPPVVGLRGGPVHRLQCALQLSIFLRCAPTCVQALSDFVEDPVEQVGHVVVLSECRLGQSLRAPCRRGSGEPARE